MVVAVPLMSVWPVWSASDDEGDVDEGAFCGGLVGGAVGDEGGESQRPQGGAGWDGQFGALGVVVEVAAPQPVGFGFDEVGEAEGVFAGEFAGEGDGAVVVVAQCQVVAGEVAVGVVAAVLVQQFDEGGEFVAPDSVGAGVGPVDEFALQRHDVVGDAGVGGGVGDDAGVIGGDGALAEGVVDGVERAEAETEAEPGGDGGAGAAGLGGDPGGGG